MRTFILPRNPFSNKRYFTNNPYQQQRYKKAGQRRKRNRDNWRAKLITYAQQIIQKI